MTAFRRAWADGARWIETDVQPSADGVPVLIHDDEVDRTTDGTGLVRSFTAAALGELDAGIGHAEEFAGSRIPHLADLLAEVTGDRRLLLEIKGDHSVAELRTVLSLIDAADALGRIVLQSFERPVLERLRRLVPDEPLGLLVERIDRDPVTACRSLGAVSYNPDVAEVLAQPGIVAEMHAASIAVMPWTANTEHEWRVLTGLGVDGMFTDRPAALLAWLAARTTPTPSAAGPSAR